jgi:hypothetical protein
MCVATTGLSAWAATRPRGHQPDAQAPVKALSGKTGQSLTFCHDDCFNGLAVCLRLR